MSRFLIGLVALIPTVSLAAPEKYICAPTKIFQNEVWLPQKQQIILDTSTGQASVYDPVVKYFLKKPTTVSADQYGDGKYRLRWKIKGVPVSGSYNAEGFFSLNIDVKTTIRYNMKLDTATKTYSISGNGGRLGYVRANGQCKTVR